MSAARSVARLTIETGVPFEEFRARFEKAVPVYPEREFAALVARGADWETVLARTAAVAPHGFLVYWSLDIGALMGLAGHRSRCVEYLVGNHTIAERMYRHDPAVMVYAPLRLAIHGPPDGDAALTIERPSDLFRSFGVPAIALVGTELDGRLAMLLSQLGTPVPPELSERSDA